MNVVFILKAFYEWEKAPPEAVPTDPVLLEAALKSVRLKKNANDDGWLQKVILTEDTHASVGIPDEEINKRLAHQERIGAPKTRQSVVAWFLEEIHLPHLAHPTHIVRVHVDGELSVEKYLNMYFGCDQDDAPAVGG